MVINSMASEEYEKMANPQYNTRVHGHIYILEEGGNEIAT